MSLRTQDDRVFIEAVQTCAMAETESHIPNPMIVAEFTVDNVTVDSLRTMQEEDETLKKCWQLAADTKQDHGKVRFVVQEGLLYQELRLDSNKTN